MDGERFDDPAAGRRRSTIGDIEDDAALGQTSIGQRDVRVTPLQAAMVAAAVANDGGLMKPYLVDQVRAPDLTVIDETEPEEFSEPVSDGRRRPAHRDDAQRRGERLRPGRPDRRRRGRRQDRHRADPGRPRPQLVHRLRTRRRPVDRRRGVREERRRHRRRRLRADRARGHRRPTSTGRGTDGAVHRQPAGRPLRDHRPDRHRRAWARSGRPATGCWTASSRPRCSRASTPATRASSPASATRPGTPPP